MQKAETIRHANRSSRKANLENHLGGIVVFTSNSKLNAKRRYK
jgi:hypothetical protein